MADYEEFIDYPTFMVDLPVLSADDTTDPHSPDGPPYPLIQPEWLEDIDFTDVQYSLPPGVPNIKFYLEMKEPIDIQHARFVLGVRVFQDVSAIETMLSWVGIKGKIREKVLKNWYSRVVQMQAEIEGERSAMHSFPVLPYDLKQHNRVERADPSSEEDGEYELDEEYEVRDVNMTSTSISASTNTNTNTSTTTTDEEKKIHQAQILHRYNNTTANQATVARDFWPLFNHMCIQDLTFLRAQMDTMCHHISCEINWDFLLCEPCTDVSVMVFLYVMSVWQSRPPGKEHELVVPVIWSLAMQLRVILPCERVLTLKSHARATDEIPKLFPIHQWR